MTKQWQELQTVNDFIESCKEDIDRYKVELGKKDKENLAGAILSFTFSDHFYEWAEQYPVINDIEALASDLEWSNSSDVDEDWGRLRGQVVQLEQEINGMKPEVGS